MAEALKSANSARPGSLDKPVPGAQANADIADILSQFDAHSIAPPAEAAPTGGDEVSAIADQFGGAPQATSAPSAPTADQFAPEPGFAEANKNQFGDFVTRLQTGLAANDNEKLATLQRKFGPENAVVKDDKIYFRKAKGEKFRRLDPATLEIVNDLIPDFAREFVTEAAMLPGEAAGAAVAGPAGATVGRVASVPAANDFANSVAQAAGVPQDQGRSTTGEDLVGMGAEAALPLIGRSVWTQIAKRLPGTEAYAAAKAAGEREIVALSAQSKKVAESVDRLAQEGLSAKINGEALGIPGANVSLMGHQLHPDSPIAQNFAAQAAKDPRFQNAQMQLAEDWGSLFENTMKEISRSNMPGPYKPEVLAEKVTNAAGDIVRAEGQEIGRFKATAIANAKNKRTPLDPETTGEIRQLLLDFGFKPGKAKTPVVTKRPFENPILGETQSLYGNNTDVRQTWRRPNNMNMQIKSGLSSAGEAQAVVNSLDSLAKNLDRGYTVQELDSLRNIVGATGERLRQTKAGSQLSALSGRLRDTFRNVVGANLNDDVEAQAFNDAMDKFGVLKGNVNTLKNALDSESSAKAIVSSIFTGKENLQKIKAIKSLSPESFASLKEEWVNQQLSDFASRENKTGFKAGQFLDTLNKKYGSDFTREVLDDGPGPNSRTVKDLLTVLERIDVGHKAVKVDDMSEKAKSGAVNAAIGVFANAKLKTMTGASNFLNAVTGRGRDHVLNQILTRDGIEKYVANYPGKIDKTAVTQNLKDLLANSRLVQAADVGGRAARATLKQQLQDRTQGD